MRSHSLGRKNTFSSSILHGLAAQSSQSSRSADTAVQKQPHMARSRLTSRSLLPHSGQTFFSPTPPPFLPLQGQRHGIHAIIFHESRFLAAGALTWRLSHCLPPVKFLSTLSRQESLLPHVPPSISSVLSQTRPDRLPMPINLLNRSPSIPAHIYALSLIKSVSRSNRDTFIWPCY